MYKSIMVPVADPVLDHAALDAGVRIARASAARLHVVHVQEARTGGRLEGESQSLLAAADWASGELDESVSFHVLERDPHSPHTQGVAEALENYARDNHIDLIVMGRQRRSLNRFLFGSIGERLLLSQDMPILFVPTRARVLPRRGFRILAALDGSAQGEAALVDAVALARALKGTITLTRVLAPATSISSAPSGNQALVEGENSDGAIAAQRYLDRIAETIEAGGVKVRGYTVPGERVSAAVRKTASVERVHVVALAPRTADGATHFAANSVTEALLNRAETALLVHRRPTGSG